MSDEHTTPHPATHDGDASQTHEAATSQTHDDALAQAHDDAVTTDSEAVSDNAGSAQVGAEPHYGVGPLSLREVSLLGVWLLAFIVSFFSVWAPSPISATVLPSGSVWSSGIDWILTIGVPTVAVFLIVLRRFSPDGIRRVGSLAVDQFASVAFSVSAVVWLGVLWTNIVRAAQTGLWLASWVVWVEFFLMTAGVFLTVLAPFIRPFDEDFRHRPEVVAHRNARPARAVVPRPVVTRPVVAPATSAADEPDTASVFAPVDEPSVEIATPAATQAFWALAPEERPVVDENGLPLFTVGPTAWALVIEDRGSSFVVRHEDGRVGYLHDVSDITRG